MAAHTSQLLSQCAFAFLIRSRLQVRNYATSRFTRSHARSDTRTQPQKSFQLSLKELAGAEMPNDVGILPGRYSRWKDSLSER